MSKAVGAQGKGNCSFKPACSIGGAEAGQERAGSGRAPGFLSEAARFVTGSRPQLLALC